MSASASSSSAAPGCRSLAVCHSLAVSHSQAVCHSQAVFHSLTVIPSSAKGQERGAPALAQNPPCAPFIYAIPLSALGSHWKQFLDPLCLSRTPLLQDVCMICSSQPTRVRAGCTLFAEPCLPVVSPSRNPCYQLFFLLQRWVRSVLASAPPTQMLALQLQRSVLSVRGPSRGFIMQ